MPIPLESNYLVPNASFIIILVVLLVVVGLLVGGVVGTLLMVRRSRRARMNRSGTNPS